MFLFDNGMATAWPSPVCRQIILKPFRRFFKHMIKLNLRWLIQAFSLALSIVCFTIIFDASKALFETPTLKLVISLLGWALLFCFGFFVLMFTSYLKQRANFTLRNQIPLFERLVRGLGLAQYKERESVSDAKQKKRARDSAA
ncbi:hypothetical protein DCC62_31280 [candidate division KSB1 bacterium]|nr:MAG: hypothetical protein DCC62_31280 [candidate division KSB1 bacterium]